METNTMSQFNIKETPIREEHASDSTATQHVSQVAASQNSGASAFSDVNHAVDPGKDVVMSDHNPEATASPAIAVGPLNAQSPMPARTGTPSRNLNGDVACRGTSQHPDAAPAVPKEAPPHGAPTRQYLNSKVTGVLLEGMKRLAKEQPKDPLRVLGEYLVKRSKEMEGI